MASNTNPSLWASFRLYLINKDYDSVMKLFLNQLSQFASQILQQVTLLSSASGLAGILNGSGLLTGSSLANGTITQTQIATSLTDLGSPAGNSTIDTKQASVVFVRVSWTTAANWTLTLNNLAQGATIYLRLVNSSGLARTFTILANTPASVAYTVNLFVPGTNVFSSGVSVASAASVNGFGVAGTVSAVPVLDMVGSIG